MKKEIKQAVAELNAANKKLDAMLFLNEKTIAILEEMSKPQSKIERIMAITGNVVTIAGIIAIADVIRVWLGG